MERVRVIDSHTEGEPTRVVLDGGPDLGGGSVADRRRVFAERFDHWRSAVVNEPRGSEAMVGALLVPPSDPAAAAGVIFFNNVGCLNACGHGTMGVAATLSHLGRIGPGEHLFETPVGLVGARLDAEGRVTIRNVPSRRFLAGVEIEVSVPGGARRVRGDVAWGGNWFFLTEDHGVELVPRNIPALSAFCLSVRAALRAAGITGDGGMEIDHVELSAPANGPASAGGGRADSRNFVLCPGGAYDRSPCGTGTSARLACLAAEGVLAPGRVWRQESIIGSAFDAWYEPAGDAILPWIRGGAWITGEATLIIDERDPFRHGIRLPAPGSSAPGSGIPGSGTPGCPDRGAHP